MLYISNAFSLQMVRKDIALTQPIDKQTAKTFATEFVDCISIIGHDDICNIINDELGTKFKVYHTSIELRPDDVLIIGQYIGPRLEVGTKKLPSNAQIEWFMVKLYHP